MVVGRDGGGVVRERAAQDDPRMHGGPVQGALEELFEGDDLVAVVEEETREHLVAVAAKAGLDVTPAVFGRGERGAVAAKPRLHPAPAVVEFEHRVNPGAHGGGQRNGAEAVVRVVEGGGTSTPDAGEKRPGGRRCGHAGRA